MYIVQMVESMDQGFIPDAYSASETDMASVVAAMLKRESFTFGVPKYIRIVAIQDGITSLDMEP